MESICTGQDFLCRITTHYNLFHKTKSKEYIVKEAEMLVEDYIHKTDKKDNTLKNKYSKLKKYSIISTVILIISLILNFI